MKLLPLVFLILLLASCRGVLPAADPVPALGPLQLGTQAPVERPDWRQSIWGMLGEFDYAESREGMVSHVAFWPQVLAAKPDQWFVGDVDAITAIVSEQLGADPIIVEDEFPHTRYWQLSDNAYRLQLQVVDMSGEGRVELLLHSMDPRRLCGPEDGFDEWLAGLRAMLQARDAHGAAGHFHFPLRDVMGEVISRPPAKQFAFKNQAEFIARFHIFEAAGAFSTFHHEAAVNCSPVGREGTAQGYSLQTPYGSLQIMPVGDSWKVMGTYYQP